MWVQRQVRRDDDAPGPPLEHRVRLSLTVGSSVNGAPPGIMLEDCGRCIFCMDKPKFGGPGTKRQKCITKRSGVGTGPLRVWASLRLVTKEYMDQLELYASQPPPAELVAASSNGPLPLIWAFRRARRARPLPPAYVLMYHCERHVQLDRTHLAISLQQHYGRGSQANRAKANVGRPMTAHPAMYGGEDEFSDGDVPSEGEGGGSGAPVMALPLQMGRQPKRALAQVHGPQPVVLAKSARQAAPVGPSHKPPPMMAEPVVVRSGTAAAKPMLVASVAAPANPLVAAAVLASGGHAPPLAYAGPASIDQPSAVRSPAANLDELLSSLRLQLDEATYAEVEQLVDNVQQRRVRMSREEFMDAFASIVDVSHLEVQMPVA